MTIVGKAQTTNPADEDDGLVIINESDTYSINYADVDWSNVRRPGDVHVFKAAKIVGEDGRVERIAGGVVFDDIQIGSYIAYDTFVTWHIPAADWDVGYEVEGGTIKELDLEFHGGE